MSESQTAGLVGLTSAGVENDLQPGTQLTRVGCNQFIYIYISKLTVFTVRDRIKAAGNRELCE